MSRSDERVPTSLWHSLARNPIGIAGLILAGSSLFAVILLISIDFFRGFANPYLGILTYFVAPAFLIAGLALLVIGALVERHRRLRQEPGSVTRYPRLDLNLPRQRRFFLAVGFGAVGFLCLTAIGSYRSYEFTESVTFCGRTCHQVMQPEYTAYLNSPHARVACVQCHIGPGATWYVKSKLSGAYQVYATIADKYPRPIPTPIADLRPAQQTCEQCHWPRKFYGGAERVIHHYLTDRNNSPWTIEMLLKIGGGDPGFGPVGGIHWHMNLADKIEYIATDKERQVIPWVRTTDLKGKVTVYQSKDDPLKSATIASTTPRVMDCIDCHNRPTHIFSSPVDAVDLEISTGAIDRRLPFIKAQAIQALTADYTTTAGARDSIAEALRDYYRPLETDSSRVDSSLVRKAVAEVQKIYTHNFFPTMKVDWRAYPDNIGHWDSPGCFRCHDGNHVSADGKVITHDCKACHLILAQGPGSAPTSMSAQGLEFQHPVDIEGMWKEAKCMSCHDGAMVK